METLINFGEAIKTVEETADGWRVGGWLVVYDRHDVTRLHDKFTKSTDYDFNDGDTRSLFYNHGLDGTLKRTKIGQAQLFHKDAGVWYEGEIKKREDYLKRHVEKIADGATKGVFGSSSGAIAHMVEREPIQGGHEVKMWPIGEVSITPTPAEPMTTCLSLKSLVELEAAQGTAEMKVDESEFKAVYLGDYLERDMAMCSLRQVNDALMYRVVAGALSPDLWPSGSLFTEWVTLPAEERMEKVRGAFAEFQAIALDLIEKAMASNPTEAAKALREAYKSELNEIGTLGDLGLVENLQKLLVANEGLCARYGDWFTKRASDRRSDYVMPQDKIDGLKALVSGMEAVVAKGKEVLGRYERPGDGGESKSLEVELFELELKFRESEFEAVL